MLCFGYSFSFLVWLWLASFTLISLICLLVNASLFVAMMKPMDFQVFLGGPWSAYVNFSEFQGRTESTLLLEVVDEPGAKSKDHTCRRL